MKILGKELTFNGNKVYHAGNKPTASEIGAAASSHTHNYAGSSSAGGNANAAIKLATARTINGTSFDGSANITTANWGTARNLNGVSVNGSTNYTIPVENYYCSVGDNNTNLYHRILTTDIATANYVDKSLIIVMHSGYHGGGFGIAKITFRTNDISSAANSQGEIKWLVRNGFAANALVFNFTNQAKNACMDVFYKSPGTYAGMTWYVLSEGCRSGNHSKQWTKYNTNASGTNAYTEANMKTLRTYTSTLVSATDAGHVSTANSANTLTTARTINGTSFNGSANITTANWGTARTITIGNTGKSVNGSANVSWSLSEIGAAAASHTHSYLPLSGGSMTGKIANSFTTNTYLAGNQGNALISSSSAAGSYVMLYRYPSTNGYFTTGGYQGSYLLQYTAKSTVDAGTNSVTKSVTLLDESGNSSFSGTVKAPTFSGALSGNASTATKLQTARTINGVSFDGTANITIPIASHNHDSNYLKTSGTSTLSGNISIDVASERVIKTTDNVGYFFNSSRIGMYDWANQRDVFAFNPSTNQLTLGSSSITTKVIGTFYGKNNIALDRSSLWIQSLGGNATCDYLRFGTNIIASNDSKQAYLIDTAGSRANLDVGQLTANGVRLTNGGYPCLQFSSNVRMEYDAANDLLYVAGTKSTSSGLREFRATQCNSTINAIIAGKRLFIQSGTPSGVATGDVWIQV